MSSLCDIKSVYVTKGNQDQTLTCISRYMVYVSESHVTCITELHIQSANIIISVILDS